MKNINLYIIFLLTLVLFSCSKDDGFFLQEKEDSQLKLSDSDLATINGNYKDYNEDDCDYIDELCIKCPVLEREKLEPTLGLVDPGEGGRPNQIGIDDDVLTFEVNGQTYEVRGANYFEGSNEFIISVGGINYATTDSRDPILKTYELEVELPSVLDIINRLDFGDFINGKLTRNDIEPLLGSRSNIVEKPDGSLKVQVGTDDGTAELRIYNPCKGLTLASLTQKYIDVLNMGSIHSSGASIIEDALTDCLPQGFDPKRDCINTRCVVDNALSNPLIANSTTSPFELKLNYLRAFLGLSEEEYDKFDFFSASDRFFIDDLYDAIIDDSGFEFCEKADCSIKPAVNVLMDAYLSGEFSIGQNNISSTLGYFEHLYCKDSQMAKKTDRLGVCGSSSIFELIELGFSNEVIDQVIEKYIVAWDVYYGTAYEIGGLEDELLEKDVTWCDMIEITNVMYANEFGLPAFAPGEEGEYQKAMFNPVFIALKATGEAFTDAAIQSLFIWIADNDKNSFVESFQCVDPFEVGIAFLQGLLPGGTQTKKAAKAAVIAAIVVMDRAIEQSNYTWEQAGEDFVNAFFQYFAEEIFGDALIEYGAQLARGAIKKFDQFINPGGFINLVFSYRTMVKWFGGNYFPGNYMNLPICEGCFFNTITQLPEGIGVQQAVEGWEEVTEIYLVGAVQDRVNWYKEFLMEQDLPFEIKTISDDITEWSFTKNLMWVRDLKEQGKTIIDLGPIVGQTPSNAYQMELNEIFN